MIEPTIYSRKSPIPYGLYFCIIIILYLSLVFYTFPDALDLTRYYEGAIRDAKQFSDTYEYLGYLFDNDIDFIYSLSLYLAQKYGLSMNIVTTLYLSIYYICCCELIRRNIGSMNNIPKIIFLYAALSAPFIWVQEISRNLAAISFIYLAFLAYQNKNKKWAITFTIASIFTHISMIVYVLVFIVALVCRNKVISLNRRILTVSFILLIIVGYLMPSYIIDAMAFIAESSQSRYSYYADMENEIPLLTNAIGYGDKIPMFFIYIYSIYLVIVNKKNDLYYWILLMLTGLLSFAIFSSLMLTNRIIMLMPLFISANVCSILSGKQCKYKNVIRLLSIIGMFCVVAHLYAYRTVFSLSV